MGAMPGIDLAMSFVRDLQPLRIQTTAHSCHLNLSSLWLLRAAVVSSKTSSSFGLLLGVRLLLELLDSTIQSIRYFAMTQWAISPSLMRLALQVRSLGALVLEPFGALGAVMLAKARQILSGLGVLPLRKMSGVEEIGLDLIKIPLLVTSLGDCALVRCAGHVECE